MKKALLTVRAISAFLAVMAAPDWVLATDDAKTSAQPAASPVTQSESESSTPGSDPDTVQGLWGRPVRRRGFHFQFGFGIGGGPDTSGLIHNMELGWSFGRACGGCTVALLHTFIQNKGILGTNPAEPDLIGGWMAEFKAPLFFPDLDFKVALGLGGTHDQSNGIEAHGGFGAAYGIDLHFPIWPRFGPSLATTAMHVVVDGQHHFGAGAALVVTLF